MTTSNRRAVGLAVTATVLGGAERYLLGLYGAPAVRREFEATLLGSLPGWAQTSLPRRPMRQGPKWSRRNMARSLAAIPASYVRGTRMLRDFANDADPAFFHLQYKREQVLYTRSLSRRAPVLWTEQGTLPRFRQWRAIAPFYRRAAMSTAGIICVSERVADDISALVGQRCPPLHVIENSVNLERFPVPGPDERRSARRRFGLGDDVVAVATVSRLAASKRVGLALDAVAQLPGAVALVCGDGPQRGELEHARNGAEAIFTGFLPETRDVYLAADVLVHATSGDGEGLPLALVEAAASGLPAIVCDDSRLDDAVAGWGAITRPTGPAIASAVRSIGDWSAPDAGRAWAEARSTERSVEKHLAVMRSIRDDARRS